MRFHTVVMVPAPSLTYAPAVGVRPRRARWALVVAAGCVAGVLASVWADPLWDQCRLLYWQRRCLNHEPGEGAVPPAWAELNSLASTPSMGTVFLHERHTPGGRRVLAAVDLGGRFTGIAWPPEVTWVVAEPASIPLKKMTVIRFGTIVGETGDMPVVDSGREDPSDPTHFTFQLRSTGGRASVIDGWVRDDDTILFQRRP